MSLRCYISPLPSQVTEDPSECGEHLGKRTHKAMKGLKEVEHSQTPNQARV